MESENYANGGVYSNLRPKENTHGTSSYGTSTDATSADETFTDGTSTDGTSSNGIAEGTSSYGTSPDGTSDNGTAGGSLTDVTDDDNPQLRVIVWAAPRSLSTVFFRSLTSNPNVKPLLELYFKAYYFGEERLDLRYCVEPPRPGISFSETKAVFEEPYGDFSAVVAKEIAKSLRGKLEDCSWLPEGYRHTFIIRSPQKTAPSLYKAQLMDTRCDGFTPTSMGFKDMISLFRLVTEHLKQPAIVLDADDLLSNPEAYLKEYCHLTGLQFRPEMLDWSQSTVDPRSFSEPSLYSYFEVAFKSTSFRKPEPNSNTQTEAIELPPMVQAAIEENMPFYRELYQHRIRLGT